MRFSIYIAAIASAAVRAYVDSSSAIDRDVETSMSGCFQVLAPAAVSAATLATL